MGPSGHKIERVRLVGKGQKPAHRTGAVFSTAPRHHLDSTGAAFIAKGPNVDLVAAEALGSLLADLVELPRPEFALSDEVPPRFASRVLSNVMRDATDYLCGDMALWEQLGEIFAFDVWIGNTDRNHDNLLLGLTDRGPQLILIDFEKSFMLRRPSLMKSLSSADLHPRWIPRGRPSAELEPIFKLGIKRGIRAIGSLTESDLRRVVDHLQACLPEFDWGEALVTRLIKRRDALRQHCVEVLKS